MTSFSEFLEDKEIELTFFCDFIFKKYFNDQNIFSFFLSFDINSAVINSSSVSMSLKVSGLMVKPIVFFP